MSKGFHFPEVIIIFFFFAVPKARALNFTQLPFYLDNLRETNDFIRVIKSVRNLSSHYARCRPTQLPNGCTLHILGTVLGSEVLLGADIGQCLGSQFCCHNHHVGESVGCSDSSEYLNLMGQKLSRLPGVAPWGAEGAKAPPKVFTKRRKIRKYGIISCIKVIEISFSVICK